MIKKIKDIKIVTAVLLLSIFSFLFLLIAGGIGYSQMNRINDNVEEMHNEKLIPITNITSIRANFNTIVTYTNILRYEYDSKSIKGIEDYKKRIEKRLNEYKLGELEEEELLYIDSFKNMYGTYLQIVDKTIELSKNNEMLSETEYEDGNILAVKIENTLKRLKDYDLEESEKLYKKSEKIFKHSIILLGAVIGVNALILLIISFVVIRNIKVLSKEMINILKAVSNGDFTVKIHSASKNEFGIMKRELSKAINAVASMLNVIKKSSFKIDKNSENLSAISQEMTAASENVASAVQEAAEGSDSQAGDLVNITERLNKFGSEIEEIVETIKNIDSSSKEMSSMANESNEEMQILMSSVKNITDSSNEFTIKITELGNNVNQINEITNFINGIADQTNLLALNAAIEAARAGEAGKGFAIVADEIRNLAEQSKESSENINVLVNNISTNTSEMIKSADEMNNELNGQTKSINTAIVSFKNIIEALDEISPKIEMANTSVININDEKKVILEKVEEASSIAEEISASSEEISASSEEMNASTEEVASTAQNLSDMASNMLEQVNKFKL